MGFDWESILGDEDLQESYNEHLYEPGYDYLPGTVATLSMYMNGEDDDIEYDDFEEDENCLPFGKDEQ